MLWMDWPSTIGMAALFGFGGYAALAAKVPHHIGAKVAFSISAIVLLGKVFSLGTMTDLPMPYRVFLVWAIAGGIVASGVELFRYVNSTPKSETAINAKPASTAVPNEPTKPQGQALPTGSTEHSTFITETGGKIHVSGSKIPGNLPFTLGKASAGGQIIIKGSTFTFGSPPATPPVVASDAPSTSTTTKDGK